MKRSLAWFLALVLLAVEQPNAQAALNVLWYSGGVENLDPGTFGNYRDNIGTNLVAQAATGGGGVVAPNTWNVTFWDGGAIPVGSFDVLVVTSPQGGWTTDPIFTDLLAAAPTLGDRVMITGQDADWHYNIGPGPANFDNPQGFLINAINWAGNGNGLGAVIMGQGDPFLTDLGLTGFGTETGSSSDDVIIDNAGFPINQGLTSAGLSNWGTSSHTAWSGFDPMQWTAINLDPSGNAVTLVSAATAGGGTGAVPEPSSMLVMGGAALAGLVYRLRRPKLA